MAEDLRRAADYSAKFLRMAAIELRRIAERAPEVAGELCHMADRLETDAAVLAERANRNLP